MTISQTNQRIAEYTTHPQLRNVQPLPHQHRAQINTIITHNSRHGDKEDEVAVVVGADAVVDPGSMVVDAGNTVTWPHARK